VRTKTLRQQRLRQPSLATATGKSQGWLPAHQATSTSSTSDSNSGHHLA
jgi:hypothetical protein